MPLLVQSELERKLRIWFYRLVSASPPDKPTRKSILSLYVSTVDRMIHLNNGLMQKAIELAAQHDNCSQDDVINALCAIVSVQATSAILEKDVLERKHLTELRQILATDFDKDELCVLCFDLGVDYEDLSDKKSSMAMELVAHLERLGRIPELVKAIRQRRPDISWSHTPEETEKVPLIFQGTPPERLRAIINGANIPRRRPATTATHILETLIARIIHGSQTDDRVQIDPNALQVLDFMNEWFQCQPSNRQQEQPGGAPAIIAQVLTQLGEQNVVLWTAYHSQNQARVFDKKVKFLTLDEKCNSSVQPIHNIGKSEDPEVRNYSMEFAKNTQFDFKRSDGTKVSIRAPRSDRAIATSPGYRFFNPLSGYVIRENTPPDIAHILATDSQRGPSYAAQVAQNYKYWIIGGLHRVEGQACQQTLESNLQQVPSDVTIHVEISGPDISTWFQHVLRQYVNSVGVNADDIEQLVQKIVSNQIAGNRPRRTKPPTPPATSGLQDEYFLRLALWLACELDLERVYIHGLKLDYVVRRCASDDEMNREVRADLLAKTVVTNRARDASAVDPPGLRIGLSVGNLEAFIKVCALRRFPFQERDQWVTLEGLSEFERILDLGWFDDTFEYQGQQIDFRVAVIPVAMFRLDPGDLKFVGAGDTTSAISFIFGCFTTQGLKR